MIFKRDDLHAIPATPHTFCAANTLSNTNPITVSCTIHLVAATISDPPIPRPSMRESTASKAIKARPIATLAQVRLALEDAPDMVVLLLLSSSSCWKGVVKLKS